MRKFVLSLILLPAVFFLQAQAFEDKIEYNKEKQACLVIEYNFLPQAVENAVVAKMNKLGYKGKEEKGMFNKDKGFRVYKDAMINDISSSRYDYVVNIDRKSKKESDAAVLYLVVMKDGSNALSRMNTEELSRAKSFLYNLLPDIEEAHLELQITAQEDVVVKAEKKFRVPSLRNVSLTFPYMHDGRYQSLKASVEHYGNNVKQSATLDPSLTNGIHFTSSQVIDLVAFLRALTDSTLVKDLRFYEPH